MVAKKKLKISHGKKPRSVKGQKDPAPKVRLTRTSLLAKAPRTRIKIIGIGGGGGSIVAELARSLKGIEFAAVNTDQQALNALPGKIKKVQLGLSLTKGLGTGMQAALGEESAKEAKEELKKILNKVDFCILVACLGGGTGSGVGPVVAEISRELGNVGLGIFTLPFSFEGEKRSRIAKEALELLKQYLDGIALISNEKIFELIDKETSLPAAFSVINKILADGLKGLVQTISLPGLVNIDFADLKAILDFASTYRKQNRARFLYLNSIEMESGTKAEQALKEIFANPVQTRDIAGADRILFNIAGSNNLRMTEVEKISSGICGLNRQARIIFGISRMPVLKNKIRLTVLATKPGEEETRKQKFHPLRKFKVFKNDGQGKNGLPRDAGQPKSGQGKSSTFVKTSADKKASAGGPARIGYAEAVAGGQEPRKGKAKKVHKIEIDKEAKNIAKEKKVEERDQAPGKDGREDSSLFALSGAKKEEEDIGKEFYKEESDGEKKLRRNGLELKKTAEEMETEITRQEEIWETPAFLRKQIQNPKS